ncbi:uncharacterized protein LOC132038428 [Lycium ferocissimum]|uniref:uncharacterized protein LOC132038428 n=1 Tax=Lycium ferocissimum TaxID=112874 RepID=UPI002815182E|nr:uncharacterized protein LOC132038428 [Lycium ferocissimum]
MTFLHATALEPLFSDHSPLCLELQGYPTKPARPFKFFNWLAEHNDFALMVNEGWRHQCSGSKMYVVWEKLKQVKRELKKPNQTEFIGLKSKVATVRDQLIEMQQQMYNGHNTYLFDSEKALRKQLEKCTMIEESEMKQKSRVHWLNLADSNTSYFHASLKNGEFPSRLLGTAAVNIPAIQPDIMKEGPLLNRAQQLKLITIVTDEEVVQALKGIDDSKAPGHDRFNSLFLKKAWPILGSDITTAVKDFFHHSKIVQACEFSDIKPVYSLTAFNCSPRLQVFLLPKKIIEKIEGLCRRFLWTGSQDNSKKAMVA